MKLDWFISELQAIADHNDASEIEVAVEGWDDNFYDSDKIEGIRLIQDIDFDKKESGSVLFIIHGQGR